jgi:hypothetical protein
MGWRDIIDEVLRLQQNRDRQNNDNYHDNPVVRIITPEWYYSDSIEVFHGIDIVWDNLEKDDVVLNIGNRLGQKKITAQSNDAFEASFCSWYQPFHYTPRTRWGIHIRYGSWLGIAELLYSSSPILASNRIDSARAAFLYLFIHSAFHYLTECIAGTIEIIHQNPNVYTIYHSRVYENTFYSCDCLEESLANRYLLSKNKECHIEKKYLEQMLLKQGPGYTDFVKSSESKFSGGLRELISQIGSGELRPPLELATENIIDVFSSVDYPHNHGVPIWLHKSAKALYSEL